MIKIPKKDHIDVYLFGSATYSKTPSDIDIAIIYKKDKIDFSDLISYRKALLTYIHNETNHKVDSILLSKEEEIELNFLKNAKHILL